MSKRRTYKAGEVQGAMFGIPGPEQGELLETPPAEKKTKRVSLCAVCGDEIHHGYRCDRCRSIGAEPGSFDTLA